MTIHTQPGNPTVMTPIRLLDAVPLIDPTLRCEQGPVTTPYCIILSSTLVIPGLCPFGNMTRSMVPGGSDL